MGIGKFHDKNLGMQYGIMAPSVVGTLIAGENCMFECTGVDGIKKFIFNKNGAYLYNSQMFVQSDNGGAAMIDPSFGFALGADKVDHPLWELKPDGTHELKPENATLYTDLAGVLHLQGVEAKGDIYANNFYFNDGGNIKTLLSETQKTIPSEYIVYGLNVINKITGLPTFTIDTNGNVNMHSGSITWDSPVIEYQYSVDNASWHSTEAATDKYRREKQVGGTWKTGYQYKGIDGKPGSNGSDANVPGYITATKITQTTIESPTIYGGEIYASDKSLSYSKMSSTGFHVYLDGVATAKAKLESKYDGTLVQLALGAGSSNNSNYDLLTLSKIQNGAKLTYMSAGGQPCGFIFQNGIISVDGEINVPARFA